MPVATNKLPRCLLAAAACVGGCATPPAERTNAPLTAATTTHAALSDPRQLTFGLADCADPAVSPDGRWLAFRASPAGEEQSQLYLARVLRADDGRVTSLGLPVRVTPPGSRSASPAFSPDGQTLLFTSTAVPLGGPPRAFSLSLDLDRLADVYAAADWQRDLAAADPRVGVHLARQRLVEREGGYDGQATFTPDGRTLIYSADRDADDAASADLYAVEVDAAGEPIRLTDGEGRDARPAVSGDGATLVFEGDADLYALTLRRDDAGRVVGASTPRRLTDGGGRQPAFVPGTSLVLYASDRGDRRRVGDFELYLLDLDSGRSQRLTFDPASDEFPCVDGDGRRVFFASRRTGDGSRQLFVADLTLP